jgi:phosphoribosylformylglycinamidine cyclo-ligase
MQRERLRAHRRRDGHAIVPGDVLVGLPSSGLHTNGYSLARKIVFDVAQWKPDKYVSDFGCSVADALLATHRSYLKFVRPLLEQRVVKGLAHITGGGITENLPRTLPDGCAAEIARRTWTVPPLFRALQQHGRVPDDEMFRTFNMGIGLIVVCAARDAERVIDVVTAAGEPNAARIGFVVAGDRTVRYV